MSDESPNAFSLRNFKKMLNGRRLRNWASEYGLREESNQERVQDRNDDLAEEAAEDQKGSGFHMGGANPQAEHNPDLEELMGHRSRTLGD